MRYSEKVVKAPRRRAKAHPTKYVEWSDEDQCYIGRCPEVMIGGVHGSNEIAVYKHLCQVVKECERP